MTQLRSGDPTELGMKWLVAAGRGARGGQAEQHHVHASDPQGTEIGACKGARGTERVSSHRQRGTQVTQSSLGVLALGAWGWEPA